MEEGRLLSEGVEENVYLSVCRSISQPSSVFPSFGTGAMLPSSNLILLHPLGRESSPRKYQLENAPR